MDQCLPVSVGVLMITVVGLNLLLYGRYPSLRRVGAVLSSALGPYIVWLAEQVLLLVMGKRLWLHTPGSGNTFIIGRDITLNDLLWIPLQDAGCYLGLAVIVAGMFVFVRYRASTEIESLYPFSMFGKWLDGERTSSRRGRVIYQVMVVLTLLLALPAVGLGSFVTLRVLLMGGHRVLIKTWIDWTVFSVGAVAALVYYLVNSLIAWP